FCFSSRRRHTRFSRDWSSDVCSSDLVEANRVAEGPLNAHLIAFRRSLSAVLGSTHPDYQMLRARKVRRSDPEDGTVSELETDALDSVPTATNGDEEATSEGADTASEVAEAG